jgi:hypothetical protein
MPLKDGFVIHKEKQSRSKIPIPFGDYYYSYKSYIAAFNLQDGDTYSSEITRFSGEPASTGQRPTKPVVVRTVYPSLPLLAQAPSLNVVRLSPGGPSNGIGHNINKMVRVAKQQGLGLRVLTSHRINPGIINSTQSKFGIEISVVTPEQISGEWAIRLPIHPKDVFFCADKSDSAIITKLPISTQVQTK